MIFDFFCDFFYNILLCNKKDQPKEISPQLAEWLLSTRAFAWLFAPKKEPYYFYQSDKNTHTVPMYQRATSLSGESILRRKEFGSKLNYKIIFERPALTRVATKEQLQFRQWYCRKIKEDFLVKLLFLYIKFSLFIIFKTFKKIHVPNEANLNSTACSRIESERCEEVSKNIKR